MPIPRTPPRGLQRPPRPPPPRIIVPPRTRAMAPQESVFRRRGGRAGGHRHDRHGLARGQLAPRAHVDVLDRCARIGCHLGHRGRRNGHGRLGGGSGFRGRLRQREPARAWARSCERSGEADGGAGRESSTGDATSSVGAAEVRRVRSRCAGAPASRGAMAVSSVEALGDSVRTSPQDERDRGEREQRFETHGTSGTHGTIGRNSSASTTRQPYQAKTTPPIGHARFDLHHGADKQMLIAIAHSHS